MKIANYLRARWDAQHSARLARSAGRLDGLCSRIASGMLFGCDISWLEVRRIVPAILACSHRADMVLVFDGLSAAVPSNLAFLKGLVAAQNSTAATAPTLAAITAALCSIRCRWLLPAAARRELLRACERWEWGVAPCPTALAALTIAFRLRPSIRLWRRMLGELARAGRWHDICGEASRRPLLTRSARVALRRNGPELDPERIRAAELIALASCHAGVNSRNLARKWLLPLICSSTGQFLPRASAAHRLCEELESPAHVRAAELAEAIERGIQPKTADDYSNVREAFSADTWERIHPEFRNGGIFTELERFAAERDRLRFWRHIESKERAIQ